MPPAHNGELLLATLADRSRQLALPADHQEALHQAGGSMHIAWQAWQAVTRAWDPLTTGTSNRPSLIAAELDDLVLWIGRLARTGALDTRPRQHRPATVTSRPGTGSR